MIDQNAPILLYDGTCGFCADSVQFVLTRDRKGKMLFAPLESAFGRSVIERHPETSGIDSVLYVEPAGEGRPERIYAHSNAVLHVATYLGGRWLLLHLTRIVPGAFRDRIYRLIARHRHRLSGTGAQCVIPSAEDRARFLV